MTQNSRFDAALRRQGNHSLWVENSVVPATWQLACQHVLTGVPENDWTLRLDPGVCLDFLPVGRDQFCVRAYGFADTFDGPLENPSTQWLGRPARDWFDVRGLQPQDCGLDPQADLQACPLFPVIAAGQIEPAFVEWLFAPAPESQGGFAAAMARLAPALGPADAASRSICAGFTSSARACGKAACCRMLNNFRRSIFFRLDLEATARTFAASTDALPELRFGPDDDPMQLAHDQMFRSAVLPASPGTRLAAVRSRRPSPASAR